ncbi:putative phospholipase B-like 2 [Amblyomma americanum]
MTLASYPGIVMSWDSYYLSSAGLAITETELVNDNQELWERLRSSGNIFGYFDDIFKTSGQPQKVKQYGDYYTYDQCPRAKMFRREHSKLKDMDSILTYIRYNDYKNDPLSVCNCTPPYNPVFAIAARHDLLCPRGKYGLPEMNRRGVGGIDAKCGHSD